VCSLRALFEAAADLFKGALPNLTINHTYLNEKILSWLGIDCKYFKN
jgi:hypothetical protein